MQNVNLNQKWQKMMDGTTPVFEHKQPRILHRKISMFYNKILFFVFIDNLYFRRVILDLNSKIKMFDDILIYLKLLRFKLHH